MPGRTICPPGVFFVDKSYFIINIVCVMDQLQTILPPSLRTSCLDYYLGKEGARRFVVINTVSVTEFEVRMGVWSNTSDPSLDIRNKTVITLHKKKGDMKIFQESPNVLRQDEFEWLLKESLSYTDYDDMIKEASSGNANAIIIYLYLQKLAKLLHLDSGYIFKFIDNFRLKYNPDELVKTPW